MSENVVMLSDRRPPVTYTITVTHHWDDRLEIFIHDVAGDARSQASVNDTIARMAEGRMNIRHIHSAVIKRIDQLMDAERNDRDTRELSVLADVCVLLERDLFPMEPQG